MKFYCYGNKQLKFIIKKIEIKLQQKFLQFPRIFLASAKKINHKNIINQLVKLTDPFSHITNETRETNNKELIFLALHL